MWLIKNGRVIDPERMFDGFADIIVEDGRIKSILPPGEAKEAGAQVLDASGLIVAPGLVDVHVHFRDPGLT